MTITKPTPKPTEGLSMQEVGLLSYMLGAVDTNGHFQQKHKTTAYDLLSTDPTVRRVEKSLIRKGAVAVVTGSVRGTDGYNIPAILKPTPLVAQVQVIETKQSPAPNGDLSTNINLNNSIKSVYEDVIKVVDVHVPPLVALVEKNQSVVCKDGDCTNPVVKDGRCYRHQPGFQPRKATQPQTPHPYGDMPSADFDEDRLPLCDCCHTIKVEWYRKSKTPVVEISKYCSDECSTHASIEREEKRREWAKKSENWGNPEREMECLTN